ncbi:MAG: hypothetical protein H6717_01235 [Polyangiaceae bacterium]|nr:hypothetical protein [Polyangiaceae bacterium]
MSRITSGPIELTAPEDWGKISEPGEVLTLAKLGDGVGALQFSSAGYRAGVKPDPDVGELGAMVRELARANALGIESDRVAVTENGLRIAAASYSNDEEFTRIWYVTDGWSVALATYTCDASDPRTELDACERIVRAIRFSKVSDS